MFYVEQLIHRVDLSPRSLTPNIQEIIQEELYRNAEGSCSSSGYIVAVLRILRIEQGKIQLNGHTIFKAVYEALVLRPQKGDIIDAPIVSTSKLGFFASVGPLPIFISNYQIPQVLMEDLGNNITVRLRIIGLKIDSVKMYAIGTLNDDYLGIIS